MAYVKPEDLVIFNLDGGNITALVTDIQFRRFKKRWKDKKTGEQKFRWKAVPYAVCSITSATLEGFKPTDRFIIAGYKLRNHAMAGKKCLVLNSQYVADFEKNGQAWVREMLTESDNQRGRKNAK